MLSTTVKTLGLRLVRMLRERQLDGQIELDRSGGTRFGLRFGSRSGG
jgi:two-component sensor histidine kinase